jgi:hypothetical protein
MNEKDFIKLCKKIVAEYANKHIDVTDKKTITEDDVFVVWLCKALQNSKALLSTTLFDGMYYELTFNGDKEEVYVDAYKKWENKCIKIDCKNCIHASKIDDITYECEALEYDISTLTCFSPKL